MMPIFPKVAHPEMLYSIKIKKFQAIGDLTLGHLKDPGEKPLQSTIPTKQVKDCAAPYSFSRLFIDVFRVGHPAEA